MSHSMRLVVWVINPGNTPGSAGGLPEFDNSGSMKLTRAYHARCVCHTRMLLSGIQLLEIGQNLDSRSKPLRE